MSKAKEPDQLIITLGVGRREYDNISFSMPVPVTKGESPGSVWKRVQGRLFAALCVFLTGESPAPALDLDRLSAEDAGKDYRSAGAEDAAAASPPEAPQAPAQPPEAPQEAPEAPQAPAQPPEAPQEAPEAPQAPAQPPEAPQEAPEAPQAPAKAPEAPQEAPEAPQAPANGYDGYVGCRKCGRVFINVETAKKHIEECKADAAEPAPVKRPSELTPDENQQIEAIIKEIKALLKVFEGHWEVTMPVFLNHGTREEEYAYKCNNMATLTAIRNELAAMAERRRKSLEDYAKRTPGSRKRGK